MNEIIPKENAQEKENAAPVGHSRTRQVLLLIGILFVVLFVAGFFAARYHPKKNATTLITELTPVDTKILGTWEEISENADAKNNTVDRIGFLHTADGNIMRYYGTEKTASADIKEIHKYRITEKDSTIILEEYGYYDKTIDPEEYGYYAYELSFPSPDEMVLIRELQNGNTRETHYKRIRNKEGEESVVIRTQSETDTLCRSFFVGEDSVSIKGISTVLPVVCPLHIGNDEPDATLTLDTSGDLIITRDNKELLHLSGEDGKIALVYTTNGPVIDHAPNFEDITFDGYIDISVNEGCGAYQCDYAYYVYNPKVHAYDTKSILSLTEVYFDKETKTINYHYKGRGLNDIFDEGTYTFVDKKYVLTEKVSQDVVDFDHLSKGYTRTTQNIVNGKMIKKTQHIKCEDVWDDGDTCTDE